MKWVLVEIDRMGRESVMGLVYDRREDAEYDRNVFLWVNPHKRCRIEEKKEDEDE